MAWCFFFVFFFLALSFGSAYGGMDTLFSEYFSDDQFRYTLSLFHNIILIN